MKVLKLNSVVVEILSLTVCIAENIKANPRTTVQEIVAEFGVYYKFASNDLKKVAYKFK